MSHSKSYLITRNCIVCGKTFDTNYLAKKTCGAPACKKIHYEEQKEKYFGQKRGLPSGTIGAISELLVCSNLLDRGYYVFRSVTPNSPFDIIAEKDGVMLKIEITTGRMTLGGNISYPPHENHAGKFDIMAIVLPAENKIVYNPEIA